MNYKNMTLREMQDYFLSNSLPKFRAEQVAAWVYQKNVEDPMMMSNIDINLRKKMKKDFEFQSLRVEELSYSEDGTVKGILKTKDNNLLESVLIPESDRLTLCVSSQIGCSLKCSFCATGKMGFTRNLDTSEIIDQFCIMKRYTHHEASITNVVFMGMGEPLLNLEAVIRAVELFLSPKAFNIPAKRITVSTAGVVPKILQLCKSVPVNLAVSLHAAKDDLRNKLVPLNRKFPIAKLFETLKEIPNLSKRHPVFFEYTLLSGINDSKHDARNLVALLKGVPSKLNIIPVNQHSGSNFKTPEANVIDTFMGILASGGLVTTLRKSRGSDIGAACGQLALRRVF